MIVLQVHHDDSHVQVHPVTSIVKTQVLHHPPEDQDHRQGVPTSLSHPLQHPHHAPGVPPGMVSLGPRSPRPTITGGTTLQFLTTEPNSGRVPPVRGELPSVGQPVIQSPQALDLQPQVAPAPPSLPLLHQQQQVRQPLHLQQPGHQLTSQLGSNFNFQAQGQIRIGAQHLDLAN